MYKILKFIENVIKFFRIKFKILYWKIKYGNHLKIGKHLTFRKNFSINMTKNGFLIIGNKCAFNNNCTINCHEKIIIGNDNLFGENVKIYDHNHIFNDKTIDFKRKFKTNTIEIGNENWFGSNVTILSKCKMGNRNVVGANVVINQPFDSENLIQNQNNLKIEKIKFKEKSNV